MNEEEEELLNKISEAIICLTDLEKLPLAKTYSSMTRDELKKELKARKIPVHLFSNDVMILSLLYDDLYMKRQGADKNVNK